MTSLSLATEPRRRVTVQYQVLPHQAEVLTSEKKITFLGAGVGSGKTDVGTVWLLRRLATAPPDVLHLISANTYPQLYDSTLRNFFKNLQRFGIPHNPSELPRSHSPINLRLYVAGNWHELICRSLDHYEALSGVELGDAWLDEVWQTKEAAIHLVLARLRDTRVDNKALLTTTLDDPTTWMYQMFVEQFDADVMRVIYASTYENEVNLPDGYIDDLKRVYSERLFKRMVMAQWVTLESGQIYYAFDRNLHVSEAAEFEPNLPICWTHDFNIGKDKPMSSCLCQIKKGTNEAGLVRPEVHIFDEIILDSTDTNDTVLEFQGRGWNAPVRIYGDASGKAKDTRSKTTDYRILAEAGYGDQHVPKKNPPLRDSHNAVNALLRGADGDVRVQVHPRCQTVIQGLETVALRPGAQYLETESRAQHVTTALRYLISTEFPIIKPAITSRKFRIA